MIKNKQVLLIEPASELTPDVVKKHVPSLASCTHRVVHDEGELTRVLAEKKWSAVVSNCCHIADVNTMPFLFSNLPGMACQIRLDQRGDLHFHHVSSGSFALFGLSPEEIERDSQTLLNMIHPEDKNVFYHLMRDSSDKTRHWNWEGRIILPPKDEIKWVNLRATHRHTSEHDSVWEGFVLNITQNKLAEIEIKRSRQRLRELSSHIENIKEQERTRIAREIHDDIGVLLTALKLDLAWMKQRLPKDDAALHDKAKTMAELLVTAGNAANNLVHSLRPSFLDYFGIVATIEIEAKEFTKRTNIPCSFLRSDENIQLAGEQSITLFRIFQETLNNIMKHAKATKVDIQFTQTHSEVHLIVCDNGKGFDESCRNKPRSFGLRGIEERIEQLGGTVEITSQLGKGTQVSVCIPLKTNH